MRRPWEEPPIRGIYLDWNATTPPHPGVLAAMAAAAERAWGNPSSVHAEGRRARAVLEGLREAVAAALGYDARDVLITSGGTEANNLAIARASALVTSRLEHPSIIAVAERLQSQGRRVYWLDVPASGRLEANLLDSIDCSPVDGAWLAIGAANHETGVIQPIQELVPLAHARGIRVHVDAVQAFGKVVIPGLDQADSVAIAAHKIRGPKGIGALAFRGAPPPPLLVGGSQERGLRPGTVDAVSAAGFWAAVDLARDAPARWADLAALRDGFERRFAGIATVNGTAPRLPHVSNLSFAERRGDELVAALDLLGVRVSSGSACSAGTAEPSPVITAMVGKERAIGAVRVSLGEDVTSEQVGQAEIAFFQALGLGPSTTSCIA